jgi:hypothetical protein
MKKFLFTLAFLLIPITLTFASQSGDFNADSKADILWRNSDTGEVFIWLMDGYTKLSEGSPGTISNDWQIESAADFNADSKTDILWRE